MEQILYICFIKMKIRLITLIIVLFFLVSCKNTPTDSNDESENNNQIVKTYYVSPSGNDSNDGSENLPWRTIQHAIDNVKAGEKILVKNGTYKEKIYIDKRGEEDNFILIEGEDRDKTIIEGSSVERDTIFFENAEYVKFSNLKIINSQRAGIRLSYSNHIELSDLKISNCGKWGIFTDFSDYTIVENCEVSGSKEEHGIYISNSSDNAKIKGNRVFNNYACGIQINADPSMGGDGISSNCTIENNIVYNNGEGGGAAINLASVRNSHIQNNLIYNNKAGGIALWDDGQGYEWGCKDNEIIHNTIYFFDYDGRWAISLKNGSTGNSVYNNILLGGGSGGFEYDESSINNLKIDYNIYYRKDSEYFINNDDREEMRLGEWQSKGYDIHSFSKNPSDIFINISNNDFHLKSGCSAIDKGKNAGLTYDFENDKRPQGSGYDIGCDERK